MTVPAAAGRIRNRAPDPGRLRAWLAAVVAVLLVFIYLSVELTYASAHLPPTRYRPVAPGAVGHSLDADFRLLSLRQTEHWGHDSIDGDAGSPDPGAVWVVAQLEVTPRRDPTNLLCTSSIVATDGRSWDPEELGAPIHEGQDCPGDGDDVEVGKTYPFVEAFQVPANEADHLAGVAIETFTWGAEPLLRPPG